MSNRVAHRLSDIKAYRSASIALHNAEMKLCDAFGITEPDRNAGAVYDKLYNVYNQATPDDSLTITLFKEAGRAFTRTVSVSSDEYSAFHEYQKAKSKLSTEFSAFLGN